MVIYKPSNAYRLVNNLTINFKQCIYVPFSQKFVSQKLDSEASFGAKNFKKKGNWVKNPQTALFCELDS